MSKEESFKEQFVKRFTEKCIELNKDFYEASPIEAKIEMRYYLAKLSVEIYNNQVNYEEDLDPIEEAEYHFDMCMDDDDFIVQATFEE